MPAAGIMLRRMNLHSVLTRDGHMYVYSGDLPASDLPLDAQVQSLPLRTVGDLIAAHAQTETGLHRPWDGSPSLSGLRAQYLMECGLLLAAMHDGWKWRGHKRLVHPEEVEYALAGALSAALDAEAHFPVLPGSFYARPLEGFFEDLEAESPHGEAMSLSEVIGRERMALAAPLDDFLGIAACLLAGVGGSLNGLLAAYAQFRADAIEGRLYEDAPDLGLAL